MLSTLGRNGRFGNQLFQLCFALGLARRLDAEVQIPADWAGRKLFKIDLPVIDAMPNARTAENYIPSIQDVEQVGRLDLVGFWQFQDAVDLYSRQDIKTWLVFQDWVQQKFPRKRSAGAVPVVAIHKRRGDYLSPQNVARFCTVAGRSYYRCLYEQVLPELATHHDVAVDEVGEEKPWRDRHCDSLGLDFLPDFIRVMYADVVIRANSSFSFWAPILGESVVYAPVIGDAVGWSDVGFVKGNHPRMIDPKYFGGMLHTDLMLKDRM
jgi:hypothetical protein